jgi:hypothetical protein
MNVEIGIKAPIFLFWEYLFQMFSILSLQCRTVLNRMSLDLSKPPAQPGTFTFHTELDYELTDGALPPGRT